MFRNANIFKEAGSLLTLHCRNPIHERCYDPRMGYWKTIGLFGICFQLCLDWNFSSIKLVNNSIYKMVDCLPFVSIKSTTQKILVDNMTWFCFNWNLRMFLFSSILLCTMQIVCSFSQIIKTYQIYKNRNWGLWYEN